MSESTYKVPKNMEKGNWENVSLYGKRDIQETYEWVNNGISSWR